MCSGPGTCIAESHREHRSLTPAAITTDAGVCAAQFVTLDIPSHRLPRPPHPSSQTREGSWSSRGAS